MSNKKEKIIIIDGNALIHRSFHALPPTLRNKNGVLVNAVYGFSSFLLKAIAEFNPNYLILTLDKKGPTFRHNIYKDYKATRTKAPQELYQQIPLIKDVAKAFSIPIFELSGYEADDIIGTICKLKELEGLEKIIITGDLDTLQLVDDETKVYTMSRGLSDSVLYTREKIIERYGFGPEKIIDYKALRGDPSDNIPGVKNVGEKTATELLTNFKDLETIYQSLDDKRIKPKTAMLLSQDKEKAFLSKKLAEINKNVPITFNKEEALFKGVSGGKVVDIFNNLGFKSLLAKTNSLSIPEKKEVVSNKKIDNLKLEEFNKKNLEKLKERVRLKKELYLKSANNHGVFFALIICPDKDSCFVIESENLKEVKDILEDEAIKKIGHDLKAEYLTLKKIGINLSGIFFDTMIASYIINPSHRNHDLSFLSFNELGIELEEKKEEKEQLSLGFNDLERVIKESVKTCQIIIELKKVLEEKLFKNNLFSVFENIEMPLIEVLAEIEKNGINFDPGPIKKLEGDLEIKIKKLEEEIYSLAGNKFNINSNKQTKDILFDKLELPTKGIKKTKTGFSTADDELEKLINVHPIISKLRNYREINKLITTYINPLPELVDKKTGRIHSHFNQAITATGRLSSTDPNLQNIPARTDEGKKIREAFVAEKNFLLSSFDYSQIELRIAAHLSNDKKMVSAFVNNKDIHVATAAEINNVDIGEVSNKMRQEAKAINFGIIYGQGPHGLSQTAGIPYSQAKDFIKKYFESYPEVEKMRQKFIKEAEKNELTSTFLGRKRPLPEINSSIIMIKKSAERIAINTPIQGAAADIIKLAMIETYKQIKSETEDIRLLLQVHDELVFEIKETRIDYYIEKIKSIMEKIVKLNVPLKVEVSTAKNWGDLK